MSRWLPSLSFSGSRSRKPWCGVATTARQFARWRWPRWQQTRHRLIDWQKSPTDTSSSTHERYSWQRKRAGFLHLIPVWYPNEHLWENNSPSQTNNPCLTRKKLSGQKRCDGWTKVCDAARSSSWWWSRPDEWILKDSYKAEGWAASKLMRRNKLSAARLPTVIRIAES